MNNIISTTTTITINSEPKRKGNAKPVYCITDGTLYASVLDAAKAEHVHFTAISMACRGNVKTSKNKQWCFVSDLPTRIKDVSAVMQRYYAATAKQLAFEEAQRDVEALLAKEKELSKRKAAIEQQEVEIGTRKAQAVAQFVALGGVM